MSKMIITNVGHTTNIFKDREAYPKDICSDIEDIISCTSTRLAANGGNGTGKITIKGDAEDVILSIKDGKSVMNNEGKIIVLLHCSKKAINTKCYYGKESMIDFISESGNYGRDIATIKEFYNSWKVSEGSMAVPILLIEDDAIFTAVLMDEFFKDFIVLKEY